MEDLDPNLVQAFREDHALLGEGFHLLSSCLRGDDVAGARRVARRLDTDAGAHIAFEEEQFYPALMPILGEEEIGRLYDEHRLGLEVLRALKDQDEDAPLAESERRRLLGLSDAMERHIAECGELFAAMGRMSAERQAELHERLVQWRRERPGWQSYAGARRDGPRSQQSSQ